MAGITNIATGLLAKAVGLGGLALIAVESHNNGKMQSKNLESNIKTNSLKKHLIENTKLDSPSTIKAGIKRQIFNFHTEENFTSFFSSMAGYFGGAGYMLANNVIPLTLSAVTVFTKGTLSKFSAAGLIAYGGIYLFQEFFGIGKSSK